MKIGSQKIIMWQMGGIVYKFGGWGLLLLKLLSFVFWCIFLRYWVVVVFSVVHACVKLLICIFLCETYLESVIEKVIFNCVDSFHEVKSKRERRKEVNL